MCRSFSVELTRLRSDLVGNTICLGRFRRLMSVCCSPEIYFWRFRLALYYCAALLYALFCVLKVNFAISRLIVIVLLCEFQRWVSARKQFEDAGVFDRGIGLPRGLGIALPLH